MTAANPDAHGDPPGLLAGLQLIVRQALAPHANAETLGLPDAAKPAVIAALAAEHAGPVLVLSSTPARADDLVERLPIWLDDQQQQRLRHFPARDLVPYDRQTPAADLIETRLGALDALTREKMQGLVLKLWKDTGKTIILITHSVEEALLLGERLIVMAPRPGRIHKEYRLPFAEMGVGADLREVKHAEGYADVREEILSMIWDMEEEIMGRAEGEA